MVQIDPFGCFWALSSDFGINRGKKLFACETFHILVHLVLNYLEVIGPSASDKQQLNYQILFKKNVLVPIKDTLKHFFFKNFFFPPELMVTIQQILNGFINTNWTHKIK